MHKCIYNSYSESTPKGRVKGREKKRKVADEIEDGTITSLDDLKASYGVKVRKSKSCGYVIKKSKDDSSQDNYFKRLRLVLHFI